MWSWLQKLMSFFQGEEEQRIENEVRSPVQQAPRQLQAKTKSIYPKERANSRAGEQSRQERERQFRFPVVPDEYPEKRRKEKQADNGSSSREQRQPSWERQPGATRDTGSTESNVRNSTPAPYTSRNIETSRNQEIAKAMPDKSAERVARQVERRTEPPVRTSQPEETKKAYKPSDVVSPVYGKITPATREEEHRIHTTAGIVYPRIEQEEHLNQLKQWDQQQINERAKGMEAELPVVASPPVEVTDRAGSVVEQIGITLEDDLVENHDAAVEKDQDVNLESVALSDDHEPVHEQKEDEEFAWSVIGKGLKETAVTVQVEMPTSAEEPEPEFEQAVALVEEAESTESESDQAEESNEIVVQAVEGEENLDSSHFSGYPAEHEEDEREERWVMTEDSSVQAVVEPEPETHFEPETLLKPVADQELQTSQELETTQDLVPTQEHETEGEPVSEPVPLQDDFQEHTPSAVPTPYAEDEAVLYHLEDEETTEPDEVHLAVEESAESVESVESVESAEDSAVYIPAINRLLERAEADVPMVEQEVPIRHPLTPVLAPAESTTMQMATVETSSQTQMEQTPEDKEELELSYSMPQLDLLNPSPIPSDDDDEHTQLQKLLLEETLSNFNVSAQVVGIVKGPSVTRFELQPAPGVKVNKITGLVDDIKLNLAAKDIRIEAPIPGRNAIGIEVPNLSSRPVMISTIIGSDKFQEHSSPLAVALGMDIGGEPIIADIKKMPHGLIAGSTGSGKSVCINSIIVSLLYKATPEQVRLLLIDPKMVELAPYNHLPHLVTPVVTEAKQATAALKWAVEEMEKRYTLFVEAGVRDIDRYNQTTDDTLPYIVIVIDELADLMMVSPQDVEDCIIRIAQKARACGIHLLLATQRPSVDVITGNIKANVPTRLAFAVFSQVDSRTILDQSGAERLLGRGDMLFLESGTTPVRLQGNFVSDDEIERITHVIKKQRKPSYIFSKEDLEQQVQSFDAGDDPLYLEALVFVAEQGQASASGLQRRFRVGYNRAARLIEMMEADGYVAGQSGGKARAVLISREDAQAVVEGSSLV
ncbi:cell division protein FtsK [Brevibacillus choshinensis]|uniref:Cell division protein FtsK n=1 Tax=Brevibacillus choshinensis TaxID=54911 RepID=A0ABR5N4P9_BRECH|nr:DNA translocase FtsK [Brevibacillus choshinensis]KQL45592.1 cell division protein FtsK [Brevibacillus choshinensis]